MVGVYRTFISRREHGRVCGLVLKKKVVVLEISGKLACINKMKPWICQIRNWSLIKKKMAAYLKTEERKLDTYSTCV